MKLPYTVGQWAKFDPVKLSLKQGQNTLSFTHTAPEDFKEKG